MPDYDFRSLSPIDFEILIRDLLQEELSIRLESFKTGRDQGIDFRYCPSADNTLIIQCKHYFESSYNVLFNHLKNIELKKVNKVNPSRYILAISKGLTSSQKDKIKDLFTPFIHSTNDIISRDDINNLLNKFPKIERHTFKLWLSSISVFEDILHNKVKNVSKDALEKISLHSTYYVQNESFHEALKTLDKHNFCVIAGIPGIGKTILAEMLLLHFIDHKYEVVKITGDISEASSLDHSIQKRIYYYDDFLGQTSLSEKLNKNEDQKLLDFIYTIRHSKKSKLILTTREYILNQARMIYEKIERANVDGETCIIDLSKYTRLNRAKILFNHLYFSNLPKEYKESLLERKNYLKIIDHENYNPRIIDLMTQVTRIDFISPKEYFKTFMSNLKNPLEIWRHAFEEQLSNKSKNLLLVKTSMPEEVFLEDLDEAFKSFHYEHARKFNYETKPTDFKSALKEADGNFISTRKSDERIIIRFHNPSIKDFLENYLSDNEYELQNLIKTASFYEQMKILWNFKSYKPETPKYREKIKKNPLEFVNSLRRVIGSRTCRLIDTRIGRGSYYKSIWNISLEARAVFVASVFVKLKTKEAKVLLERVLNTVEQRIEKRESDREYLFLFLKKLKESSVSLNSSIIIKAKSLFMSELELLDDFEPLCDFVDLFPDQVSEREKGNIIKDFKEVAASEVYDIQDDPDHYRDDIYKIESFAKRFDIDMTDRIEELENMARELESERVEPDEYEKEYNSNEYCNDNDIESIFDILK